MSYILPSEVQLKWLARLYEQNPTEYGVYKIIEVKPTKKGYGEQRIIVNVLDENNLPLRGIEVAFAYSTAEFYPLKPNA